MINTKARIAVLCVAFIALGFTIYQQAYEVSSVTALAILFLIWSHFKQGTVAMAAKAYHLKDYSKTEKLLKEIKNPELLIKNRRGFYEFMMANIELQKDNKEEAERHFQIASRFPLRNQNDTAIVLVQLANLNLRKEDYVKVRAYIEKAKTLKVSSRVQNIIEKLEKEIPKHSEPRTS